MRIFNSTIVRYFAAPFLLFLTAGIFTFSQTPSTFNYQAVLRDSDGSIRANESVSIELILHQGTATGTPVYSETHSTSTNSFGLVNLELGSIDPTDFALVNWSSGPYFVEVKVDDTSMGTSELLSVPYALNAASVKANSIGSDEIADNAVGSSELNLTAFTGWDQDVSDDFSGDYNDLINRPSSFDDADADPGNELQSLSLSTNTLSLSRGGGSVELPSGGSSWTDNANDFVWTDRYVGIHTSTPSMDFEIYDSEGIMRMNHNTLQINTAGGDKKVEITTFASLPGWIGTYGPNTSTNVVLGYVSGYPNNGSVGVLDQNSNFVAGMLVNSLGVGILNTEGPNGNLNFYATSLAGYPNNGVAAVYDENNNWQARMYVNSSSQGVIEADIKNFRMAHPNIPGTDIVYTSVEGPEVAAYVRGTSTLLNGSAEIAFPEHFQIVASENSLTIQITPLSADSRGLAVIRKNSTGFEVKELFEGSGTYSFDWEAKCIRKGYENFQVLQESPEMQENMRENAK